MTDVALFAAVRGVPPLSVQSAIDLGRIYDAFKPRPPQEFRIPVRRPADLLIFDIVFDNLELAKGPPPYVKKKDTNAPAYLVIEFPGQSFGEESFLEHSDADGEPVRTDSVPLATNDVPTLPASRIRMAGRSRIAFSMPADQSTLPYTLPDVLAAVRTWPMRLDVNAAPDPDLPIFGRNWFAALVASTSWQSARTGLSSAFTALDPDIAQAMERSARGIAERTAVGLGHGIQEDLHAVLQEQMQGEINRLAVRYPQLREGLPRDAATALLALQSAEELAKSTSHFDFDISAIGYLPFLPIIFAPHEPSRTVTALELPYRVILSPIEPARWLHRDHPVEHNGRTELWHTRLTAAKNDFGADGPSKVRAIWSPDYGPAQSAPTAGPPRMSLDPLDRNMLVRLMAGFDEHSGRHSYKPRASEAKRLHLSALGALLDVEGNWNPRPNTADIEQWRHLAALGRDQYVRVMYAGYLCHFGHAASLMKVTERKFKSLGNDPKKRVAVLRQRYFIVVRERVKHYSGADHKYQGRNFPFTQVEILTRITPDLYEPGKPPSDLKPGPDGQPIYFDGVTNRMAFWPMVPPVSAGAATDFRFDIAATDLAGNRVVFSIPLLFVGEIANRDPKRIAAIKSGYNAPSTADRRHADLGGATISFAPYDPADKGDPRLPTAGMTFAAGDLSSGPYDFAPNFYPESEAAEVGIRAVQKMLGLTNFVAPVRYPQVYKDSGFDAAKNAGQLFLQLTEVAGLKFGGESGQAKSDALGALASPQMAVQGLSKIMGPVSAKPPADLGDADQIASALKNVVNNTFDPTDFFDGAKILGGISLSDILDVANSLAGPDVPKMLSREFDDRVEASFDWKTTITKSDPLNLIIPRADKNKPPTTLAMNGLVTTPIKSPSDADFSATAAIDNFKVNLFGFIIVWFELLRFVAKKGQKPDVQVTLREGEDAVQFGGPLEFVNTLRKYIPSNGFSDPPALSVTPSGISASYSLTLPTIGVGIFSLSNTSLGAGFNLPFDSKPVSVRFNFSEREHPFSLTVSLLGGGGFFAIGVSSRGVTEIEAALEFGAAVTIDLGVASGGVEIKAGVYFHWLEPIPDKGSVDLAGYVRIHGELTVIAIISVSLTFNLQLGYHKDSNAHTSTMYGEATLVVEIEVLFFSADVSVSCRREFGGAASDPKFIDLVPTETLWTEYCDAYAREAA